MNCRVSNGGRGFEWSGSATSCVDDQRDIRMTGAPSRAAFGHSAITSDTQDDVPPEYATPPKIRFCGA